MAKCDSQGRARPAPSAPLWPPPRPCEPHLATRAAGPRPTGVRLTAVVRPREQSLVMEKGIPAIHWASLWLGFSAFIGTATPVVAAFLGLPQFLPVFIIALGFAVVGLPV